MLHVLIILCSIRTSFLIIVCKIYGHIVSDVISNGAELAFFFFFFFFFCGGGGGGGVKEKKRREKMQ